MTGAHRVRTRGRFGVMADVLMIVVTVAATVACLLAIRGLDDRVQR